ncbi:MAG: DoxX family membrane protein [Proteobacteria bacterium]|nr:DoxX family membrane protein [Pseudomonadota bacterium]
MTNKKLECLVRWTLGGVFVYASIHKILDPSEFAKIIYGYQLVPGYVINLSAIILPFVELFTGLFLLLGIYPRSSAILANVMLGIFMVAISINLIRGHEFDCGCFSVNKNGHTASNIELLIRDAIWFVFGLLPILFRTERLFVIRS